MSLDEYYRRLELPHTASPAEIKRAYRRLRAKYHPDRNKGREAAVEPVFKRVQEAFEILIGERQAPATSPAAASTQAQERARQKPRNPPRQPEPDWTRFWQRGAETEPEASPREPGNRPPIRGANCLAELFVPVEIAIHGGSVEATYMANGPCLQCLGQASHRCSICRGTRIAAQRKTETVRIAPGVWDGQRLEIAGAGHPGANGGAAGDAIFSIVIVCGAAMRREGLNVACDVQVDFVTAMLGGRVEAQALGRSVPVTIPPNAQAGSTIRMRGQGLTDRHGARGDLTLHLALAMPAEASYLTEDEREQLRAMFAAAQHRANRAASDGANSTS